MKTTSAGV